MIWLLTPYLCIGGLFAGMAWGIRERHNLTRRGVLPIVVACLPAWPLVLAWGFRGLRRREAARQRQ